MRHGQPLDDLYFGWLCSLAGFPEEENVDYLRELHSIPFEVVIPNDENREVDGLDLRRDFFEDYGLDLNRRSIEFDELECSIFEMILALSERISYQSGGSTREWVLIITENLGVRSGRVHPRTAARILNRREYAENGKGGMFPLMYPRQDQKEVEIWYQMSAYLVEHGDF